MRQLDNIYKWKDISMSPNGENFVEGVDAIKNAVYNLIMVSQGERFFNTRYGSDLEDLLFQPMDEEAADGIKAEIQRCISKWDPRIAISRYTKVIPLYDENTYKVIVYCKVLGHYDNKKLYGFSLKLHRPD